MLSEFRPGVTVNPAQAVAASTSAAPSCGFVMVMVADARFGLSESVTVTPGSTTTGPPFSTNAVVPAVVVTTVRSFTKSATRGRRSSRSACCAR